MARPRDSQKSKLYKAEKVLVERSARLDTVPEMRAWVEKIVRSRWMKSRYPGVEKINVLDGRGRRRGMGVRQMHGGYIAMPSWTRCEYYILHEITHVLTSTNAPSHGRLFCRNYLALIERWMGKEAARDLRESFREHRVKWYPKRESYEPKAQVALA